MTVTHTGENVGAASGGPGGRGRRPGGGPHPYDVHVGLRIRHRRALNGLNQMQLAGALGISFQSVQKYERGAIRVSASRLQEIANVLGVPVAHFFDGLAPAGGAAPTPGQAGLSPREIHELNETFAAIGDKAVRAAFLCLLRDVAGDRKTDPEA